MGKPIHDDALIIAKHIIVFFVTATIIIILVFFLPLDHIPSCHSSAESCPSPVPSCCKWDNDDFEALLLSIINDNDNDNVKGNHNGKENHDNDKDSINNINILDD